MGVRPAVPLQQLQAANPEGEPSALQSITPGSVVLFGSHLGGEFVLDTAFVVASSAAYTPATGARLHLDQAFRTCTLALLAAGEHGRSPFTLFHGATRERPVGGMFSFTPARADGPNARFARPAIGLPGMINPRGKQSP